MAEMAFDADYYLSANPDVQEAIVKGILPDAATHFRVFGAAEGRNPNAAFNSAFYLAQNPDVRGAIVAGVFPSAWEHYLRHGAAEGRMPSSDVNGFDGAAYLAASPDVKAAGYTETTALSHYVFYGILENRQSPALVGTVLSGSGAGAADDDRLIPTIGLGPSTRIDAGGQATNGDTLVLTKDTAPLLTLLDLTRSTNQNRTGEQVGSPTGPTLIGFENIDGSRALLDLTLTGLSQSASVLTGGAGRDVITGGAGSDILTGNTGNDSLTGDAGTDTLIGGLGNDSLAGGTGDDTLSDDGGDDQGFGDAGNDVIDLGTGRNLADGGAGNDTITANSGTETLTGGAGNDSFRLRNGALQSGDSLQGGEGQDALLLHLTAADAGSFIFDTSAGAALGGIDALVLMDMSGTSATKQFRIVLTDGFLAANGRSDGLIIDARGLPNASQLVFDLSQLTAASAGLLTSGAVRILASPTLEVRDQAQVLITSGYVAATGNSSLLPVSAFTLISQTGITAGQDGAYNSDRTILVPQTVTTPTPPTPPTPPVTPVTPTAPAPTLVLTTGLTDSLVPAAAGTNESFTGGVGTLNGTDTVNGNGGTDTLTLTGQSGATINNAGTATVTDIDTVSIQTAAAASLNGTGLTSIGEVIVTGAGALTVVTPSANLATNTPFVLGTGYAQTLTDASGLLTAFAVDGSATGAGISTTRTAIALAVRSASTLTSLTTGAGTATLTGAGALTLGTVTGATQIDGSALTGALTHTATAATVRSGSANDTITLGIANSRVDTGGGDDTIIGGANLTVADTIIGGAGSDALTLTARMANTDLDNVTGLETITFANGASYTYVISTGSAHAADTTAVTLDGSALTGASTLTFNGDLISGHAMTVTGGTGNDSVVGGNLADSLSGGDGNDTIAGSIGDDTVIGAGGNDNLGGYIGNDSLVGGAGNDTLVGQTDNDTLDGGLGDDSLDGGIGNDSLIGGAGNDYIFGDSGDDQLLGGDGNDALDGGADDDTFVLTTYLTSADVITGGTGTDTLIVTASNAGSDIDRVTQVETITLSAGADYTYAIGAASVHATDTVNVILDGSALGAGNALSFSGSNTTGHGYTINGGVGADSLVGSSVADSLSGGNGNDTLSGGDGNDTLVAGVGSDSLAGGNNDDTFTLATNLTSADTVMGGAGADTLTVTARNADTDLDRVIGVETITLTDGTSYQYVISAASGFATDTTTVTVDGDGLTGSNTLKFDGTQLTGHGVTVLGGAGADSLIGGGVTDALNGGGGNDTIDGGNGNDFVRGFTGADSILGGAGIDVYYQFSDESVARTAETVNAVSIGANETLTFGNGVDVITNYTAGTDRIGYSTSSLSYTFLTVGSNASSLAANNHYGIRGNFSSGVFTINGTGADTLVIVAASAAAIDDASQTNMVVLLGVTTLSAVDFT